MNPWIIAAISWALSGKNKSPQEQIAQKRVVRIRSVQSPATLTHRDRLGSTNVLKKHPMSLIFRGVVVILLMFAFIFSVILYSYWMR